jgi:hypothetical protein
MGPVEMGEPDRDKQPGGEVGAFLGSCWKVDLVLKQASAAGGRGDFFQKLEIHRGFLGFKEL